MNTKAAFFSCIFVAVVSFLSSIYVFSVYGFSAGMITIISGLFWIGLGFWFKYSQKS